MIRLLAPVLLLFVPLLALAETFVLRGTVRDPSRNTLPGVKVVLQGTTAQALTDDQGQFVLTSDKRPTGQVMVSRPGYGERHKAVVVAPTAQAMVMVSRPGYGERHLDLPVGPGPMEVTMTRNQNDARLVRYSTQISLSHSLTTVQSKAPALLPQPLTDEVYRAFVARHGELPAEEVVVRVYVPANATRVSAIFLISEHGIGGPIMEHPFFRQFAERHGIALVGVLGDPIQRGIYPSAALDELLANVGKGVRHPEIATVPMLTFGHSNGTGFSVLQAALQPDRVLGWVSYQSGASWHLVFPGIERCPGLVMHGQKDKLFVDQDRTVATLRSERNAPVSLLVAGDAVHWPADRPKMYEMVLAFAEACLRVRAPQGLAPGRPLAPVQVSGGWLGGHYDRAAGGLQTPPIAPYRGFKGEKTTANWLPDETFARTWQRFSGTGSVAAP